MGTQEVLEDPRNYLHMEPWTQLVSISWQSVEKAVEIDNPFDDIRHNARTFGCMLWKPPSAVFKWLHHLRTEEEVLQYCITQNWTLPGYSYDEEAELVLFALRPIEQTPFFQQLDQFWDLWVSSSLSIEPRMLGWLTISFLSIRSINNRYRYRIDFNDKFVLISRL
jgi:hypothetical protein